MTTPPDHVRPGHRATPRRAGGPRPRPLARPAADRRAQPAGPTRDARHLRWTRGRPPWPGAAPRRRLDRDDPGRLAGPRRAVPAGGAPAPPSRSPRARSPRRPPGRIPADGSNGLERAHRERHRAQRHHVELRLGLGGRRGRPHRRSGSRSTTSTATTRPCWPVPRSTCGTATGTGRTRCTPTSVSRRELPARRPGGRRRTASWSSPASSRPATTAAGRTSTSRSTRAWPRPRSAGSKLRTSQIALPQDVCEEVYNGAEGYEESVTQPVPGEPRHRHGVRGRPLAAAGQGDGLARRGLHDRPQRAGLTLAGGWEDGQVPSALPAGDPVPPDGALPGDRARGPGRAAVRLLRARAVLHRAVRLLRLQHLHGRGAGRCRHRPGRLARDVRRGGDRRGPPGPPGARRPGPAGLDGLLRRGYADAAAAGRTSSRSWRRSPTSSGWCPAPRSPPRPTPTA